MKAEIRLPMIFKDFEAIQDHGSWLSPSTYAFIYQMDSKTIPKGTKEKKFKFDRRQQPSTEKVFYGWVMEPHCRNQLFL